MTDLGESTTRTSAELVVGWDREPASAAALRYAVKLARHLDAHLHVVHIADIADLPIDPDAWDYEQQFHASVEAHAVAARKLLDELGANWTYHAMHGRPPDVLAELAEQVDAVMIVLGAPRGGVHSFIDTFAGQSVAHQLTRKHARAVLLVPESSSQQTSLLA
ncbi:MAG: universal stress protein [Mycobacteriaceae bacterium]|nr:universal stress protein [Mycobacteriaceae bacterium]